MSERFGGFPDNLTENKFIDIGMMTDWPDWKMAVVRQLLLVDNNKPVVSSVDQDACEHAWGIPQMSIVSTGTAEVQLCMSCGKVNFLYQGSWPPTFS